MTPESLIFDIDGTLWDSRALVAEGMNLQLEAEGLGDLAVSAEILRPLFGLTITKIADAILPSIPLPERYALMQRCMDTEQAHLKQVASPAIAYPRVKETLEVLSGRHRLFIVSNSEKGYPRLTMDALGIGHLFRGDLCFGDTGTEKGETIRRLMKEQHIADAVYIGDTQGDLEASAQAGIPFVWASYGFGNPKAFDYKIDRFADLAKLF